MHWYKDGDRNTIFFMLPQLKEKVKTNFISWW